MADANANLNMEDQVDNGLNYNNAEMMENAMLNSRRQPYLCLSPLDTRYPHRGSEDGDGQQPLGRSLTSLHGVPNQERVPIPPPNDQNLRPPNTHEDVAGAGAAALDAPTGAGTLTGDQVGSTNTQMFKEGTQGFFPLPSAGGKVSAELRRLGTTNNPGYSETSVGPNARRTRKLGLDPSKARHSAVLDQFDDALEEFVQMTNPIEEGDETTAVNQYEHLQRLVKEMVNSAHTLMDAYDNVGAVQEMDEVHRGLISRQEEMKKRYDQSGVDRLFQIWNQRKEQSLSGGSQTSLTSIQRRRGALAAKRVSVQNQEKIAAEELRIREEERKAQIRQVEDEVQRKKNQASLHLLREQSELDEMEAADNAYDQNPAQGDVTSFNETQPPPQGNLLAPTLQQPPPPSMAPPPPQGGSGNVRFTAPSGRVFQPGSTEEMVDDTLERMVRGNSHPGSITVGPPISTRIPTSATTTGNASSATQSSPGMTHDNPSATQSDKLPQHEGKVVDKLTSLLENQAAIVANMVSLQAKRNDESHCSDSSGNNWAASRQLAWSNIKSDTKALQFDGKDLSVYKRWKTSLEEELKDLDRSPQQWLDLLAIRTKGLAAEMVVRAEHMAADWVGTRK